MASGDGTAAVLVRHPGAPREEVAEVFGRRWSNSTIADVGAASPTWEFAVPDAVERARQRRWIEPLRLVVLAQRAADANAGRRAAGSAPPIPVEPVPMAL